MSLTAAHEVEVETNMDHEYGRIVTHGSNLVSYKHWRRGESTSCHLLSPRPRQLARGEFAGVADLCQ